MGASGFIALVGYSIEAIVQFKAYPPVKSWESFLAGLTIGDISPVDFGNIVKGLWGMVGTELFIVAILIVVQWIRLHQAGSNP